MAEKKGAGAEPKAAKKAASSKGTRGGEAAASTRNTRSTRASRTTGEMSASASDQPKTRRTASAGGAGGSGRGSRGGGGAKRGAGKSAPDLRKDLRDFAGARPDGWSHDDWLQFLDDLKSRGHNINDRDAIGSMLERERLSLALERIPGVGPQRVKNIADKYGYLWRLRETNADQLAREANVPKPIAEKVLQAIRG